MSVSVSSTGCAARRLRPLNVRAPALKQFAARAREGRLQHLQGGDAIEAEMAEVLAQLAPRGDHARALEVAQRHRPDHTLGDDAGDDRDSFERATSRRKSVDSHRCRRGGLSGESK